ncbi:MAG: DMT family transporter, partial [Halobacteria archaeon]|nr:DMT family transporter [Halobacteria archaeon]
MGATVKAVSTGLPTEVVVFMRGLFGVVILLPLLLRRLRKDVLTTRVFHLHLLRAVLGVSAMYCFFYALANLQLADGMLLKMTAPLFMPLIAAVWLFEKLGTKIWLAVGLGFVGVALVLKPEGEFNWIALVGLAGGMFAAGAKVTVRRLGQTEPTIRIVFYFSLVVMLIATIPLAWAWRTPTAQEWVLLFLVGLFGTLGQLLLTRGYSVAAASQVAPFTYFSVVFAALYGYLFWDETLDFGFIAGAMLIAVAGIVALRSNNKRHKRSDEADQEPAEVTG